ncbi:MAG: type II-A CRISPR-associated protein Csn2 [Tenericutes bacterium]|nr:type II-A CRISPR-associated protein Csn2 [Mycoplasmatota bacterium]
MKLVINFLDNDLYINSERVLSIEVENKSYFYRIVNCFNSLYVGDKIDEINFYDEKFNEINLNNKILIMYDFFNFDFNSKKNISKIYKLIEDNLDEKSLQSFNNLYSKLLKILKNELNYLDINIKLDEEYKMENILKIVKLSIEKKDSLMDNLFLLIDLEKILKVNEILVFVNLKQYLSKDELKEFYKYIVYNNLCAVFVDSQTYGIADNMENKIIIDDNLNEFVL